MCAQGIEEEERTSLPPTPYLFGEGQVKGPQGAPKAEKGPFTAKVPICGKEDMAVEKLRLVLSKLAEGSQLSYGAACKFFENSAKR